MDLDKVDLAFGNHSKPANGTCLMEAISVITNEKFTDRPICVAMPLVELGIQLNDTIFDDSAPLEVRNNKLRNRYLRPLIPCLIGTARLRRTGFLWLDRHQDAGHNELVKMFIRNKFKDAFGYFGYGQLRRSVENWKIGVKILAEAAQYAKDLMGPPYSDKCEACDPDFMDVFKAPAKKEDLEEA